MGGDEGGGEGPVGWGGGDGAEEEVDEEGAVEGCSVCLFFGSSGRKAGVADAVDLIFSFFCFFCVLVVVVMLMLKGADGGRRKGKGEKGRRRSHAYFGTRILM